MCIPLIGRNATESNQIQTHQLGAGRISHNDSLTRPRAQLTRVGDRIRKRLVALEQFLDEINRLGGSNKSGCGAASIVVN